MKEIYQARLHFCLQTILELEPQLAELELDDQLQTEFRELKELMHKVRRREVQEDEVRRVEEATTVFLEELQDIFGTWPYVEAYCH